MTEKIVTVRETILKKKPLIHCITNPISINGCANVILSVGAKPIMAEHPKEVCEITDTADALLINLGNITDTRMKSMLISLRKAKENHIPILLDAVGTACSKLRRSYAFRFLKIFPPTVIKGNYSEIASLYNRNYSARGVDADTALDICQITKSAKELAEKYNTVVIATGRTDIISDGSRTIYTKNGTSQLASITGTGCMLGALCAAFLTALDPIDAAVSACVYFGICGELAKTDKGNGSFSVNLIDRISTLTKEDVLKYIKIEEIEK